MTVQKSLPQIRFPQFTDDWEQRKLDNVMSCITDYVAAGSFADIRENVTYLNEKGYAQLVRTVDLKKKFTNEDFVYVDEKAFNYLWRVNLNEECIVLPNIGANIGEVYYVEPSDLPEDNNVLGPNAILLKTNEDNYFVFTLLNSDTFQKQLFESVGSSGQPKFNKTELKSIEVSTPEIEEQEKIGAFFRQLDILITLHQCELDGYKQLKQAMLQKMFPKKGETVPEIRFPQFTGDWEQRKLEDMIEVCSGRDYKHLEEGNIPVYGTGGYMLSVSEALSDEQDAIGIGRKGTINNPFVLKAPFWTVDTLFYCIPRKDFDLSFVFDIFQNVNWKTMDESTGVPSLSKVVINKVETLAPDYAEQQKIGEYFQRIDNLITLHQRELDGYKKLKQAMLQKMFV